MLDWVPADGSYRLWGFDPTAENGLTGPVKSGKLPKSFSKKTTVTALETLIPIDEDKAEIWLPTGGESTFATWRQTYSDHFPISVYINTVASDDDVDWH